MDKHFLADMMGGTPEFRPEPWYNPDGDCIVYKVYSLIRRTDSEIDR